MKLHLKGLMKVTAAIVLVLPLMGNQSCDQKPSARTLKKRIDFGRIDVRTFTVKNEVVDLNFVINGQLQLAVNDSPDFYYAGPVTNLPSAFASTSEEFKIEGAHFGLDDIPQCYRDLPQFVVGGAVTGYEFTSSNKITFGYTPTGDLSGADLETSVQVDTTTLNLYLSGVDPIMRTLIGMGSADSKERTTKINAIIDYASFKISPEFYFKSKLADVGMKGLTKSLAALAKSERVSATSWEAQVADALDTAIIINAGSRAGLQCGDVLEIYNQTFVYQDGIDPCTTTNVRHVDSRPTPDATITLGQVKNDYAMSSAVEYHNDIGVQPGAVVRLKSFGTCK